MGADVKFSTVEIPTDVAKVVKNRILPYIEKYHNEQLLEFKIQGFKSGFDLTELCFSCYTQGLSDAQQLK